MRIRRPKRFTPTQLFVVTAVGIIGGIYIWKPLILKYKRDQVSPGSAPVNPNISKLLDFVKKKSNLTVSFMTKGIVASLGLIIGYKFFIEPQLNKRKRLQAEEYANFIFEKELQRPLSVSEE